MDAIGLHDDHLCRVRHLFVLRHHGRDEGTAHGARPCVGEEQEEGEVRHKDMAGLDSELEDMAVDGGQHLEAAAGSGHIREREARGPWDFYRSHLATVHHRSGEVAAGHPTKTDSVEAVPDMRGHSVEEGHKEVAAGDNELGGKLGAHSWGGSL